MSAKADLSRRTCKLCGKKYTVPKGVTTHATCPDCAPQLVPYEAPER